MAGDPTHRRPLPFLGAGMNDTSTFHPGDVKPRMVATTKTFGYLDVRCVPKPPTPPCGVSTAITVPRIDDSGRKS